MIRVNLLTEQKRLTDLENKLMIAEGKDRGKEWSGSLGWTCTHCYIKMDNQQGSTLKHMELHSVPDGNWLSVPDSLDGRGIWGRMDTRICMAESLRCSPEIIMTLLVNRLYPITKSKVSLKIKQNIRVQRWHSSSQKRGNLPLLSPGSESAWFSLLLHSS